MEQHGLLRIDQVATLLALRPSTVRKLLARGAIEAVRLSPRAVRVRRSDVERIIRLGCLPNVLEGCGKPANPAPARDR